MSKIKSSILLVLLLTIQGCQKDTSILRDFYEKIDEEINDSTLLKYQRLNEDYLSLMNLELKDLTIEQLNSNKELTNFFENNGLYKKLEMSTIMVASLHRKLNGKEIDLVGQIEEFKKYAKLNKAYLKDLKICKEEKKIISDSSFKSVKGGDTLLLSFPTYQKDGQSNAFLYTCPNGYSQDTSLVLQVTAEMVSKDKNIDIYDSLVNEINVRIISISDSNTLILLEKFNPGDSMNIDLGSYGRIIKKVE